jgi:hypothetical protein
MIAQGAANCVHGSFIQRILAGNTADSIGSEKLSHHSVVGAWYLVFSNCPPVANGRAWDGALNQGLSFSLQQ